jgi:hypothetical protein
VVADRQGNWFHYGLSAIFHKSRSAKTDEPKSGVGQDFAVRSVEPHASFTSPADIRDANQVVALGPMLSTSDRFRYLELIAGAGRDRQPPTQTRCGWSMVGWSRPPTTGAKIVP